VMSEGLEIANSWTAMDFNSDVSLWQNVVGTVRKSYLLGLEKSHFLNLVPWLFARIEEEGVKLEIETQWSSTAPENHHEVTREIMTEGSMMRLCFDNWDVGEEMPPMLASIILSIRRIPHDDMRNEGPHATMTRIQAHSTGSGWAWQASTHRLDQNLADYDDSGAEKMEDFDGLWQNFSNILRGHNEVSLFSCLGIHHPKVTSSQC